MLALSLISGLLTLMVIEGLIRVLHLYPTDLSHFDERIGAVYTPGASGIWLNPNCWADCRQIVTINEKGLRDHDLPYVPSGTYRVMVLGDSFAASLEVGLEETFHVQLERLLGYEVIAAGHGGWGTDNELLWYRQEGINYAPDLVLLLLQPGNDVQDNSSTINYVPNQRPAFSVAGDQLVLATGPEAGAEPEGLGQKAHQIFLTQSKNLSVNCEIMQNRSTSKMHKSEPVLRFFTPSGANATAFCEPSECPLNHPSTGWKCFIFRGKFRYRWLSTQSSMFDMLLVTGFADNCMHVRIIIAFIGTQMLVRGEG